MYPLTVIVGRNVSDHKQFLLEPQKALYYFLFMYTVILPNTLECVKVVELAFKIVSILDLTFKTAERT